MNEVKKNTLSFIIEQALKKYAHFPAYYVNNKSYSYLELDLISSSIARYIKEKTPDQNYIGIYAVKNFETYASIIGIIRAGKAYVPLSPKFPASKTQRIIEKSKIKTVLDLGGNIPQEDKKSIFSALEILNSFKTTSPSKTNILDVADTNPAYLLFTSGTTGEPKGVSITRNQLKNYLVNISEIIPLQPTDRCSQTFELNFDLSVHDIFHTLIHGASLFIPEEYEMLSPGKYIQKNKISHLFCIPSLFRIMDRLRQVNPDNLKTIEKIIFCGEALTIELVEKIKNVVSTATSIINLYGPTETTIAITYHRITTPEKNLNGIVSIGRLFNGNKAYLIPSENNDDLCELAISGNQVISNYYGEENDSAKFFSDKNGVKWYKTGDLVRKDEEGLFYFAGRNDEQIKWNGYRIELGEIEAYARKIAGTGAVCCVLKSIDKEQLCLVLEGESKTSTGALRKALNGYLPAHLLPQQIVSLPVFPLNSNGKTDRKKIIDIVRLQLNG